MGTHPIRDPSTLLLRKKFKIYLFSRINAPFGLHKQFKTNNKRSFKKKQGDAKTRNLTSIHENVKSKN